MTPPTVIFDIGGVFIDWDPEHLYRSLIPEPDVRNHFLTKICNRTWNHQLDLGLHPAKAVDELAAEHPQLRHLIEPWWTRWDEMLGDQIPGTRSVATELRDRGHRLIALTNWSNHTWPMTTRKHPFLLELFDDIVVSGRERLAKPDPTLYRRVMQRHHLAPGTTLFVDDTRENLKPARRLGITTHHFTNAELLRQWLDLATDT